MGHGDWIMATGQAKAHFARTGRMVAFGDGIRAWWSEVFENNPKVCHPDAMPAAGTFDWIRNYGKGNRPYLASASKDRYAFTGWRPECPGEFFFTPAEIEAGARHGRGFVVIESRVKPVARNKQWPVLRYQAVADALLIAGYRVVHFGATSELHDVEQVDTPRFRDAAAVLANASLYIGAEGGLHHAAAALGVPGIVMFGGFISPETTGYPGHVNLFTGGKACGNRFICAHCGQAMEAITVDEVVGHAKRLLARKAAA